MQRRKGDAATLAMAAALDQDAVLHTTDTDVLRFGMLRRFNPITGTGSSSQRRAKGS